MLEKKIYGAVLIIIMKLAGKDASKKFDTRFRFHKKLDLTNPKTLRDKVIYIENHCPSPMASKCTDKWEVRKYVTQKGYADNLVPVYGEAYSTFESIPFDLYPKKFVLKATHGCKMNYFCTDKSKFDFNDCKKQVKSWLKTSYGTYSGEWHYLSIPHRVYCEEYLDDADKMVDYKFHCINGVPYFLQVNSERDSSGARMKVRRNLYDMDWKEIEGLTDEPGAGIKCPEKFEFMKQMVKDLSKDFDYVRVDLYELNGKVYFGELTFTPQNGVFPHFTDELLMEMGEKLKITQDKREK